MPTKQIVLLNKYSNNCGVIILSCIYLYIIYKYIYINNKYIYILYTCLCISNQRSIIMFVGFDYDMVYCVVEFLFVLLSI